MPISRPSNSGTISLDSKLNGRQYSSVKNGRKNQNTSGGLTRNGLP